MQIWRELRAHFVFKNATDALLIVDAGLLSGGRLKLPPGRPLIVLVRESGAVLPDDAHELSLPLRPAKLRALVGQLQKALAKSIP